MNLNDLNITREGRESLRSENSIRNVIVNLSSQLLSIVMSFICRTVFIQTLGATYLGINGVFGNFLSLFALAELGIGTTIIFHMYQPLAVHDKKKVGALMALFKKTYQTIGLIIGAIGLLFTPFYHFFTNDLNVPNLTLIYFLYVFNSVITYFFSYKQCIITADQKNYVVALYQYGLCIVQNILQILALILTRNFILYFCLQILFSFFTNFFLARKAGKMYPYLKKYEKEKLSQKDKSEIVKNIKAMFMHRFGGVVVNGTDSLVISKFFGVAIVGIYSNYFMITTTLNAMTSQIFNGITASVGNLGALESDRKSYHVFKVTNFIGFWIFSFCSICLFCLFNPFVQLWTRSAKMLLPVSVVFFIVANFYTTGMRQAVLTFKNSFGLFWYDRYKAVFEALINLIFSIVLAQKIGVAGVFLGTLISTLTTDLWVEPLVLYRHGFHQSTASYFFRYAVYTVLTFAVGFITWYLCSLTGPVSFLSFMLRCFICLIVPNLIYFGLFWRSEEFQYLKRAIKVPAFLKRRFPKLFADK